MPTPRSTPVTLCLALAAALLASCAGPSDSAYPADHTAALPADRSTQTQYAITIDDLAKMLPDVAGMREWAVVRIDNDITALQADLITADDRPIEVRAQQVGRPKIAVQIRYGRFGDETEEARFHQALATRIEQLRAKEKN